MICKAPKSEWAESGCVYSNIPSIKEPCELVRLRAGCSGSGDPLQRYGHSKDNDKMLWLAGTSMACTRCHRNQYAGRTLYSSLPVQSLRGQEIFETVVFPNLSHLPSSNLCKHYKHYRHFFPIRVGPQINDCHSSPSRLAWIYVYVFFWVSLAVQLYSSVASPGVPFRSPNATLCSHMF